MDHYIKINPYAYEDVLDGRKTFEIRFNDRGYQRGDTVIFMPWDGNELTKLDRLKARISYVTNFEQKENWVVFGFKDLEVLI